AGWAATPDRGSLAPEYPRAAARVDPSPRSARQSTGDFHPRWPLLQVYVARQDRSLVALIADRSICQCRSKCQTFVLGASTDLEGFLTAAAGRLPTRFGLE